MFRIRKSLFGEWTIIIFLIVLILGLTILVSMFAARNRLDSQYSGSRFQQFNGLIDRQFTAQNKFLNIVVIVMKNPGLQNMGAFKLSLIDEDGSVVREMIFSGQNFGDPGDIRFQFEPITSSAGRTLNLRLEALGTAEAPVSILVEEAGSLAFTSFYRTVDKGSTIGGFIDQWRTNLRDNSIFFLVWVAMLGIIVFLSKRR